MRYEGRPYQQRMTAEVVAQNTLLAAPPGLGKTAAALDGIDQLVFDHLTMGRVLVVAPKIVATDTWPNEIAKWDNFHRLTHRVWRAEDLEFERVERRFEGRVVGSKLRPRHGDALRERIVGEMDQLCTGCGYCLPCPRGIPIPQYMDIHNLMQLNAGDDDLRTRFRLHWGLEPDGAARWVSVTAARRFNFKFL